MKGISPWRVVCRLFRIALSIPVIAGLSGCIAYDLNGSVDSLALGTTCTDNLDNDHDGWFDGEDPDCPALVVAAELGFGSTACNDGLDNDGDLAIDSGDADCDNARDGSESTTTGGIHISEFMANPAAVSDSYGEWFEIHNDSAETVNLNGWIIADAAASHVIGQDLVVPAGGYAVFSRYDSTVNGLPAALPLTYVYGTTLYFSNSGDEIKVMNPQGSVMDAIVYDSGDVGDGHSTVIDAGSWCLSTMLISGGAGDYGSPGAANEPCT